jgi:hypothetical protein
LGCTLIGTIAQKGTSLVRLRLEAGSGLIDLTGSNVLTRYETAATKLKQAQDTLDRCGFVQGQIETAWAAQRAKVLGQQDIETTERQEWEAQLVHAYDHLRYLLIECVRFYPRPLVLSDQQSKKKRLSLLKKHLQAAPEGEEKLSPV